MARRRYQLGRRGEAAAVTRQRIVEATLRLHDEQGIVATSVRDVAGRAGVAPATVLHHFARMDDLIQACGELANAMAPMPTEADLAVGADRAERIELMTRGLFSWWERLGPGWDHLQVDRRVLPRVDAWLRDVAARHRQLVAAAVAPAGAREIELATAVTTHGVWRSLRDSGLDTPEAASQVAGLITDSLGGPMSQPRSSKGVH